MKAQARWAEAEACFRGALAIRRNSFGKSHSTVNESLTNLVFVLNQQGKPIEAKALLEITP
jgi:hypothetical protein